MEQQVLVELINEQLKPHNKTYSDVENITKWFMRYTTTKKEQSNFCDWAVEFLMEKLKMSKKLAEIEVSWFILTHGLKLNKEEEPTDA